MSLEHLYKEVNKHPSQRELLRFGGSLLGLFLLAGGVLWLRGDHPGAAVGACALGAVLGLTAVVPGVGRFLYVFWMGLGLTIGLITTPVLLLVLYLTVFTPVACVMRVLRRDVLRRRYEPKRTSYWEEWKDPDDPKLYFKQY